MLMMRGVACTLEKHHEVQMLDEAHRGGGASSRIATSRRGSCPTRR